MATADVDWLLDEWAMAWSSDESPKIAPALVRNVGCESADKGLYA
jgi:hypothetical protein